MQNLNTFVIDIETDAQAVIMLLNYEVSYDHPYA